MSYTIIWQPNAESTYSEELDYIYRKWNFTEVEKFENLVFENLKRLERNPLIGKYDNLLKVYRFVISKQTTLYYSFSSENLVIDLYLFWNNQKNPEELNKLL